MNKEWAVQTIVNQCHEPDSFIVELHLHRFDEKKYQKLVDAISLYIDLIRDDSMIDRQVAGCLFDVFFQIETALRIFDVQKHSELGKVQDAHAKLWELIQDLFNLPNPR